MKKHGILNSEISTILSHIGHTDLITIADAGLPIPENANKIDLSLKAGVPSFIDVLTEIIADMVIEKIYIAQETEQINPNIYTQITTIFKDIEIVIVPNHQEFKHIARNSRAFVRTGEVTPYANIILQAGVFF